MHETTEDTGASKGTLQILKLKIEIVAHVGDRSASNVLEFEGALTPSVEKIVERWFTLAGQDDQATQAQIDALAARAKDTNDQLSGSVTNNTPPSTTAK